MSIVITALCAFALSVLLGLLVIPALRALKAGQSIREVGPSWHNSKQGTPTMGGIIFIGGCVICILTGFRAMLAGELEHIFVLVFALVFGAIGFADDFVKVKKKRNLGLTAPQKLLLQFLAAALFLLVLRWNGSLTNDLYLPFFNVTWRINWIVYLLFAMFVIVGCVNAVNLTDGIDGLATGVTIPVMIYFTLISVSYGKQTLALFPAALLGGLFAFLCFNFHPAKVFMGDTGSLFLGGAVCGMAFALDMPVVLLPVGLVYVIEALSDIIQVAYFKLSHGKRVFKMAPIHHHFEMCGWSEVKIFGVFTSVTAVLCVLTYFGTVGRL
ncbi:MAG: phospho-N-acetylmuramoyl-pentapeptide-transferase [Oscillospiraceae bacterium]|nr:phospho-N-acetylmuramoyl-pentapeptide-transferase [Oscillospiraceae bacterium]